MSSSSISSVYVFYLVALFCSVEVISYVQLYNGGKQSQCFRNSYKLYAERTDPKILSLIKKGKVKLVDKLVKEVEEAGDSHPINQYLKMGALPPSVDKAISFHYTMRANVFGTGTIAVLPEVNCKVKTGFIVGMPPPEILGGVLRDAGAKGIVVSVDSRSGGATTEDFMRYCKEQSKACLFLPGPIPIIWNDIVLHRIQIAQAGALGASAIILNPEMTDEIDVFIKYAFELDLEPVVLVKSVEDALVASSAGARCLCLHAMADQELVDVKVAITAALTAKDETTAQEMTYFAKIRPEEDFPIYHEIELSWLLRDSGFSGVWPSPESIYGTGMPDIYQNVLAMRAKASRIFLSPRQFLMDRKKEGAQEYLGDILY